MARIGSGTSLVAIAVTGAAWFVSNGQVTAQLKERPVPDLSSNQVGWVVTNSDFQPVPGSPSPVTFDPARPYISNATSRRTGAQPTYRIADLSNPNVKPWAKEIMKRENEKVLAGGIGYTARASCMPGGVPGFVLFAAVESIFFLQTPKQVTMVFEGDAQIRRVHLGAPHSANPKPTWYGESVGHYEGDTLVIDTVGLNNRTYVDNYRTPHTEKLHVVERYTLRGDTLDLLLRVEDPDTFYEPWMGSAQFRRVQRPSTFEAVCAENNQQLFDYQIPTAHKPDF
jgi:hypothetical protein